jgi:GntR family transcriptional repressor for pyruvate dehydrogenase complex
MKALKEKGWVKTFVGKGTFIVDNVTRGIDSSLDVALRMDPGSSFGYLIEVREILEPEIAALAAQRASDEQIARIREVVDKMSQALIKGDLVTFLEGDMDFHVRLAEATGNPLILMILNPVVKLMRDQQEYHVYNVSTGVQKSQNNHQMIMAALEKRNSAAARKRMYQHILQVRTDVNAAYEAAKKAASNPLSNTTG